MQKLTPSRTRRGSFLNPSHRFSRYQADTGAPDGIDEPAEAPAATQFFREKTREVVNKVDSPDLPMPYSLNPYQGCEHGCVYCYARNSHGYWGYSSGLDFEQKIVVKDNAPATLEATLRKPNWQPGPVMLSGNTDCYQPAERRFQLTRQCLEVFLKYRHPVGIITKNHLVTRDLDLLRELAGQGLAQVFISLTTQDETLRRSMEPRTSPFVKRLEALRALHEAGVPTGVMIAPVIPGLNHHEIPALVQAAAEAGAQAAAYGLVRLNGDLGLIFEDWLRANYPHRADKVMNMIAECHGGQVNDSRFGLRMRGEGGLADSLKQVFDLAKRRWMPGRRLPPLTCDAFIRTNKGQLPLF